MFIMDKNNLILQIAKGQKDALQHLTRVQKAFLLYYNSTYDNYQHEAQYAPLYLQKNFQKHQINALRLLSVETPREFCQLLETPIEKVENIINKPIYEEYEISKKRGGKRTILSPDYQLKEVLRSLNHFLQSYYLWLKPNEVHGFVINPKYLQQTNCTIVSNAKVHIGKKHILNIDLKNFFPNISAQQVKNLFTSSIFQYNEQLAIAITLLTTYKAHLPTGSPTSPVISNFVCLTLDSQLSAFCQQNQLSYTRYADDLTFSSEHYISDEINDNIKALIKHNGFEINTQKLHIQSAHRRQVVTGITVNEKVNVDRKLLKKIRAMLHDLAQNGVDAATKRHFKSNKIDCQRFTERLHGYINFVGQVRGKDDALYLRFLYQFTCRQQNNADTKHHWD